MDKGTYSPGIVIVRSANSERYAQFIAKAVNLQGIRCGVTTIPELEAYLEHEGCRPDTTLIHNRTAIYHRTRAKEDVFDTLRRVEQAGYEVINSADTVLLSSDKHLSIQQAVKHNIPAPQTVSADKHSLVQQIASMFAKHERLVLKPRFSQGDGRYCYLLASRPDSSMLDALHALPFDQFIIQEYVPYKALYRVIVINGQALAAAVFFDTPSSSWKCSVCMNPAIQHCEAPPPALLTLTETFARIIKAKITFVDWFATDSGWVFNEVNTACNLAIHERISRHDISTDIGNCLASCLRSKHDKLN